MTNVHIKIHVDVICERSLEREPVVGALVLALPRLPDLSQLLLLGLLWRTVKTEIG